MAIYTAGRRRTMIILLLSSILLITLDLRGNAVFNAARSGFGYAMRPFEIAGEVVTRPVTRVWDGMTEVDDLERENARLQQQIDTQRSDQVAAQAALQENYELRRALNLESLASLELKTCQVIGSSPSNFDQRVEIDCGSLDSLRVGMPVVNDAGLVGKITNVSPETSIVMLVSDPLYSVPVKVIAEVHPTPTTTTPATVPSGLNVEDVTTTTSTTTTTTTVVPRDESWEEQRLESWVATPTTTTTAAPEAASETESKDTFVLSMGAADGGNGDGGQGDSGGRGAHISPREGLTVAFRTAVEMIESQLLKALLLGILVAGFVMVGVDKRHGAPVAEAKVLRSFSTSR